jgi:hypothetical protein
MSARSLPLRMIATAAYGITSVDCAHFEDLQTNILGSERAAMIQSGRDPSNKSKIQARDKECFTSDLPNRQKGGSLKSKQQFHYFCN